MIHTHTQTYTRTHSGDNKQEGRKRRGIAAYRDIVPRRNNNS